jgi:hypothetical protein
MPMALTFSVTKQKREDETNWRDSTIEREWKVNIHEFSSGKSISKIFGDGGVDGDGKRRSKAPVADESSGGCGNGYESYARTECNSEFCWCKNEQFGRA